MVIVVNWRFSQNCRKASEFVSSLPCTHLRWIKNLPGRPRAASKFRFEKNASSAKKWLVFSLAA